MNDIDTNELCLRVQGAFSAGEMRGLLQRWGQQVDPSSSDATRLSRELVRSGVKRFGLAELVRRLQTERPLVEWPSVAEDDARWAPRGTQLAPEAAMGDAEHGAGPTLVDEVLAGQTIVDAPPSELEAPVQDTPAEAPRSAPRGTPDAPSPGGGARKVGAPLVFEPAAPEPAPARGLDPKHVAAGAVALVLLAAVAFGAGLAWKSSDAAPRGTEATADPAARPRGPAARAAAVLQSGIEGVARMCAVDPEDRLTHGVFVLAREDCGDPRTRARRPRRDPRIPDLPPEPNPPSPPEGPATAAPAPKPAALPVVKSGCLDNCQRVRADCNRACGAEPSEASLYDAYNACKGRCLSSESRCRLACN